jgi:hypothetical protein
MFLRYREHFQVRSEVLTATSMKMAVVCHIAPCGLVDTDRRFREVYCLHITQMMEAVSSSEMSVSIYQTTRCYMTDDSHLHTRRRENLRSHDVSGS